jgi:hypothetical protein
MLRSFFILLAFLIASTSSQAALIEYQGYSRHADSDVVTGGGLEWLKWDVTKNMSIVDALLEYQHAGWSLASNAQMALLLNDFQFGKNDWNDVEWESQSSYLVSANSVDTAMLSFFELFGYTDLWEDNVVGTCGYFVGAACPGYIYKAVYAFYGNDADGDQLFNLAHMFTGRILSTADGFAYRNSAELGADYSDPFWGAQHNAGVALVRTAGSTPLPVSLPGSFSLFFLGLVALAYRRRTLWCC